MLNIFQYLYDKKSKKIPLEYKLLNKLPLNEDDLIINGDLDLEYSKINSLPDNLTVKGYLDLSWSKIKSLPNNLRVDGWLDVQHTPISELPEDLYVGGDLYCNCSPLAERIMNDISLLKKYQKQVKGEIEW